VDRKNEVLAPPESHDPGAVDYEYSELPNVRQFADVQLGPIDVAWLLWRKRRFLIRVTAIGASLFIVLSLIWPKRYTASATLMPPDYNTMSELALSLPGLSSSDSG